MVQSEFREYTKLLTVLRDNIIEPNHFIKRTRTLLSNFSKCFETIAGINIYIKLYIILDGAVFS